MDRRRRSSSESSALAGGVRNTRFSFFLKKKNYPPSWRRRNVAQNHGLCGGRVCARGPVARRRGTGRVLAAAGGPALFPCFGNLAAVPSAW